MFPSPARTLVALLTASALTACTTVAAPQMAPLAIAPAPLAAAAPEPAPLPSLIADVKIPHSSFQLANGLTVLVHEDHKAPVIGLATWYNAGSKDEVAGKTGFAHLFEHLMFNGSENLPQDYFKYLQQIGATDYNGTTDNDRTNFFETVPTAALERALFMESDRMGHLLGVVSQKVLDNQRSVVQNEKRQGDNEPGGLVFEQVVANLFPEGHPYHHTVIGSMADLDHASLADVANWFRTRYGPNNAVLVLAGDIDPATARPLVEKYFGSIPRGPVNNPARAIVPTLPAPKSLVLKDRVATTTVSRYWAVPGLLDPDLVALDVGGSALGGLARSRFDKVLVKGEQLAVSASAGMYPMQRVGIFFVQASVKPGVDPAKVEARLDQLVAQMIAEGPAPDEVERAALSTVGSRIRDLEDVGGFGGKAVTLAEGQTLAHDSDFYARNLAQYASITPAKIQDAMRRWLTRPALSLRLEPGDRPVYAETKAVKATGAKAKATAAVPGAKRPLPPLNAFAPLDFPTIVHTRLSNGIAVDYAQRGAVPITQLALSFDAGTAADSPAARGLQALSLGMLDEGTETLSSQAFAEARERLGAEIGSGASLDRSTVSLSALSANLAPSLALLADVVRRPAYAPAELERVRAQALTGIEQMRKDPQGIASRALPALLYGSDHPYAVLPGGDEAIVRGASRDQLLAFRDRWFRPDNLKIYLVSDRPLAEVQPLLEAQFGTWAAPTVPKGIKQFAGVVAATGPSRIVLIDRPGSPQSYIAAAEVTPVDPRADVIAVFSANDVLGGNFLSRLNMDLREEKGWSYGVSGSLSLNQHAVPYTIVAPVQANQTGPAIAELIAQVNAFLTTKGVSREELDRTVAKSINQLPGQFESAESVLGAMMRNDLLGRPDDYYERVADKYRVLNVAALDRAIRAAVDPRRLVWVVVGDAKTVRPQLDKIGLPIEVAQPR